MDSLEPPTGCFSSSLLQISHPFHLPRKFWGRAKWEREGMKKERKRRREKRREEPPFDPISNVSIGNQNEEINSFWYTPFSFSLGQLITFSLIIRFFFIFSPSSHNRRYSAPVLSIHSIHLSPLATFVPPMIYFLFSIVSMESVMQPLFVHDNSQWTREDILIDWSLHLIDRPNQLDW